MNILGILGENNFNTSDKIVLGQVSIENIKFLKNKNLLKITLFSNAPLPLDTFEKVKDRFKQMLGVDVKVYVNTVSTKYDLNIISKYLLYLFRINIKISIFKSSLFKFDEETSEIEFLLHEDINENMSKLIDKELRKGFKSFGFNDIKIAFKVEDKIDLDQEEIVMTINEPEKKVNRGITVVPKKSKLSEYSKISLFNIQYPEDCVRFKGEVLAIDVKTFGSGKKMFIILVTDYEGGINVKLFESKKTPIEKLESIKKSQVYNFFGNIVTDKFSGELVFDVKDMYLEDKEVIVDTSETKRVELHLHTTMSEMDGVCDVSDVVEFAFNLGHDGVAITDHGSVQSFAKANNKAKALLSKHKDRKFKMIYGCEMNMVEEKLSIVKNPTDNLIEDQTFVVFDLETTGLSSHFDRIIEFGAVKIQNHEVKEKLQLFINPEMDIPLFITGKTNITNAMVEKEKKFSEVAHKILDFIKDSVLVAHNASFDYGFLNESLKRINMDPITNTLIDTLDLARAIHSDRRSYRLGNIARLYKITYDEDVAHRADYDAQVLSEIFLRMTNDLRQQGVTTFNELQSYQGENSFSKLRASHVVVLAKNQQGIKDLYELVSESYTKTLAVIGKGGDDSLSEPRIMRNSLDDKRENLLLGSSCLNGEVFEMAANKDDASLEKAISFYDYIEIQPIANYSNLLATHSVSSLDRLKEILRRIIDTSIKLNKLVVATGDVHYLSVKDKKFRDVYINAQGVGGVRHPLYIYNSDLRKRIINPDQHFRTTDEMLDCFKWLNDKKLAKMLVISNSRTIYDMIEYTLPVPEGTYPPIVEGSAEKLTDVCFETAHKMYGENLPEIVEERLKRELESIISNGYAVVYYVSHLLVKKSNEDGYLVGSRGSVGSSFVATMSKITEVNPLAPHYICSKCHHTEFFLDGSVSSGYDLPDKHCPVCDNLMSGDGHNIPFETFLGFNGDKVPDIDLNFSNEYQSKAHAFTKEVFDERHVFRAGTIGTVADKTAFGYVSGYLEEMGLDHISKATKDYLASGCVGIKRTTGQHPGGIIVIPENMDPSSFTPIQYPANDKKSEWMTTHFDFHDIHDNVLKFDILGHVDPTAMRLLYNISNIDPTTIPMNDPKVISLFTSVDELHVDTRVFEEKTGAIGLPEFGTKITRRVLEEAKPKSFSDLVIISGLTHGTDVWANNAQTLIQSGIKLDEVIGCRDDIMTYLIEKKLEPITAFNIMESVRKGKGLKPEWEAIMKEHSVPDWYIDSCKKIKYMFPKAHACAYVIMALRIAWFKVYYPHYFYIQCFTLRSNAYEIETMSKGLNAVVERMNDINRRLFAYGDERATNKEKDLYDTLEMCHELYARGYKISNIDLYKSKATEFTFDPSDPKTIIPSFITVDGLGEGVARSIEEARVHGEFISKEDLINRTQLSSKLVEKLTNLGCLNGLDETNQMSLF